MSGRKLSDAHKAKLSAHFVTNETRKKISASVHALWSSKKHRAKHSSGIVESYKSRRKAGKLGFASPEPYVGYTVSPPWMSNKGRYNLTLYNFSTKVKKNTSLARYIASVGFGMLIPRNLDVDHTDCNHLNDRWDNLQLLSKVDNASKGSGIGAKFRKFKCPVCMNACQRKYGSGYKGSVMLCSRKCVAQFQTMSKNGRDKTAIAKAKKLNAVKIICTKRPAKLGKRISRMTGKLKLVLNYFTKLGHKVQ
jgi:transposase-like protein